MSLSLLHSFEIGILHDSYVVSYSVFFCLNDFTDKDLGFNQSMQTYVVMKFYPEIYLGNSVNFT